jgi:hypothetical protein
MLNSHEFLLLLPAVIVVAIVSLVKGTAAFIRFRQRSLGSATYTFVKMSLIAGVLLPASLYGGDYLLLRVRMTGGDPTAAIGSVTYFNAPQLKSGRYEIDFSQPQIQKCTHSLFPHLGYAACWTLKKDGPDIRPLSRLLSPVDCTSALQCSLYYI